MADPDPKLDDLLDKHTARPLTKASRPPDSWRPGIKFSAKGEGRDGLAVVALPEGDKRLAGLIEGQEPEWRRHLEELGYGDVAAFVKVTEIRAWNVLAKDENGVPVVRALRYLKAKVVRTPEAADRADVERLKAYALELEVEPPALVGPSAKTLLLAFSDWQAGKRDVEGGAELLIRRVHACIHQAVAYVQQLRRVGYLIHDLVVVCLGDLVESCSGHYAMQAHSVELHMRAQRAVVRGLIVWALKTLRPHFRKIEVRAVPGNHGEERRDGKAFTSFSDNNDVCIIDQVGDIVAEAPWADGVDVYTTSMSDPQLSMSFVVENEDGDRVAIGLAHGHQAASHSRGDPAGKVKGWWDKLSATRHHLGDVDLLLTGHYHHLRIEDRGAGKTWFQAPTLDGGSFWWWEGGGSASVAGMLAVVLDPALERGFSDVKVLDP